MFLKPANSSAENGIKQKLSPMGFHTNVVPFAKFVSFYEILETIILTQESFVKSPDF